MSRFEYLTTFVSIFLGLGLADLMQSLYRLVQARRRVRFDWLPLAWAFLTFLAVALFFWNFYKQGQQPVWGNFYAFFFLLIGPVVLFLASANALPDEVPASASAEARFDLEAFYFERPPGFFVLFILHMVHTLAMSFLAGGTTIQDGGAYAFRGVFIAIFALLAWRRERLVHTLATLATSLAVAVFVFLYALRLG